MIAFSRPFWPLFLHVLGAMVLVGAMMTVLLLALAAWRRPDLTVLAKASFRTLLVVAIPAWLVMRVCAQWIHSKEFGSGNDGPTWIDIGFAVADLGLLFLLVTTGAAFWWQRSGKPIAGRIVTGLASVYLVMLAIAWLAMSGKWD
jgi:uncharacterized membrane protein (UPF0182 family)